MNSSLQNAKRNNPHVLIPVSAISNSTQRMEPFLPDTVEPSTSDKIKNSISSLADRRHVSLQQLHESAVSTTGPSSIPVQTRHTSGKSPAAPPECPSSPIYSMPARSSRPTVLPAAGGHLVPPNNTQTGESIATSAASPEAAPSPKTDQVQDIFREPLEIPGQKKKMYVYRHADARISDEHKKRYPQIIDLFRQKLPTVKALSKSRPANTLYKMKMCGPDREKAQPSILICHPWIDKDLGRQLWKTLREKSLRVQYEDTPPAFGIYIFFSCTFWMLGNSTESLSIYMNNGLIGARLVSNDTSYQVSTITCGISFTGGKTIFALTSAHAFEDHSKEDDKLAASYDDSTTGSGSLESDDTSDYSFSSTDDEYEWDELEVEMARERQGTGLSDPNEPAPFRHDDTEGHTGLSEIKPGRVLGRLNDPKWANLDWALVEIPSLEERSLFGRVSDEDSGIKPACPSEAVGPVLVATASGLLKGTLSSIPSYLASSRNSVALTEIWTLTLVDHGMNQPLALIVSFPLTTV